MLDDFQFFKDGQNWPSFFIRQGIRYLIFIVLLQPNSISQRLRDFASLNILVLNHSIIDLLNHS